MEKRMILAIALSMLVLLTWSTFAPKPQHIENKIVTHEKVIQVSAAIQALPQESQAAPTWAWENPNYKLIFYPSDAAIKEVVFKKYFSSSLKLSRGLYLAKPSLTFSRQKSSDNEIVFTHQDSEKKVTKRFIINNSNYSMELEVKIENLTSGELSLDLPLVLGVLNFTGDQNEARMQDVTVSTFEKVNRPNIHKENAFNSFNFIGLRDRYFCLIAQPQANSGMLAFIKPNTPQESVISFESKELKVAPGAELVRKFSIYLGPLDLKSINAVNASWSVIVNYGAFDFISQLLVQLLEFINRLVHNWGWSIVILSILIYAVLYPLTLKQLSSMKKMQGLQPKIEELKRLYKDNPQKLNKETMELYRTQKINPLGGCLPMILQIPVFFALYQALMRSVVLKGADFLWIKDLSQPDRLFVLASPLPVLGSDINLLPILMSIGMFFQQKFSMQTTSGTSAEQQKIMLVLFPIMFAFIFYRMPSGLVLYWFVNSMLMLINQFKLNRTK